MRRWAVGFMALLTMLWVGSNLTVGLTAGLAFGKVFPEDYETAGAIAGALFQTQGYIGGIVLGLVMLLLIFLGWRNWVDQLKNRAVGQIILALLVAGLHVAVISVNDVVLSRGAEYDRTIPEEDMTPDDLAKKQRFESAHKLGERIFGIETLLLALVSLGATVHLIRTSPEDG